MLAYLDGVRPALVAAVEKRPTASSLLALGRADAAHGLVRAAAQSCRHALRLANEAQDEALANEAFSCLSNVEPRIAHVVLRGAGPGTVAAAGDGPEVAASQDERVAVDPGTTVLRLRDAEGAFEPLVLALAEGEERVLDIALLDRLPRAPPPQPVALAARPITLPGGTVALRSSGFFTYENLGEHRTTDSPDWRPGAGIGLGLRAGLTDDIEVSIVEAFSYGYAPSDVLLGLGARLLQGDFELGLDVTGRVPVPSGSVGGGYLAVRGSGHPAAIVRIDASVGGAVVRGLRAGKATGGLFQPTGVAVFDNPTMEPGVAFGATLSPIPHLHLGLDTGLGVGDFTAPASMFVPLAFRLGGVVASGDAPELDVDLHLSFPYLFLPVRGDADALPHHADRNVVGDTFWLTLDFRGYLYL
ncbi:MAG: hypothetical protein HY908_19065 [Myxococcales bacterium]|nr:hypothetical protein [Myxococcales bacterium]